MSERAALLAAICAHPDDDTLRLVYADWLDEHGDGKRAAAIRAAVAHHRLSTADTVAAVVSDFLRSRLPWPIDFDGTLSARRAAARIGWAAVDADLGACRAADRPSRWPRRPSWALHLILKGEGVPRVPRVTFHSRGRGFFDTADIDDAHSFLAHADAIFRAAPITRLWFRSLTAEQAARFVAAGHLARVRELTVTNIVEPGALRILGTHRDAAGVRKLELHASGYFEWNSLGAIAAGTQWTGLEDLDVSGIKQHHYQTDEGAIDGQLADLLARPQFRALRRLNASASRVGDRAVRAIARNLPELRFLELAGNPISARGWSALAASKSLSHLRHLDLGSYGFNEAAGDAAPFIAGMNVPNLAVLHLGGGNDLSGTNPKVLARSGRGPGLRVLDLGITNLTAESIAALAACPAVRGVWYLSLRGIALSNETFGDESLERFLARTAFERLTYLDLSNNALTARGAKTLALWPGAANLQCLGLRGNVVGAAGAAALAGSPYLKNLKAITASGRGVAILTKRFKKGFVP